MSNYERIKAMSFDEMADFLGFFNPEKDLCPAYNLESVGDYCRTHNCTECAKKYLKKEGEQE